MIYSLAWNEQSTVAKVFIIIGLVVLAVYFVNAIVVIFHEIKFKRRLKRKTECLSIVAVEERRYIILTHNYFAEKKKPLEQKYEGLFEEILKIHKSKISSKPLQNVFDLFAKYRKTFAKNLNSSNLDKDEIVLKLRRNFFDIDYERRKQIALYNSDIDAFNYWVGQPLTCWIFFLLRIKKRKRLN